MGVAKFCAKPHWKPVKCIVQCLKGTPSYGLLYSKNSHKDLIGFLDADQAGDLNNHNSISQYMFLVNGTAVSWRSNNV